jgi:hypothetical protein
MPAKPVPVMQVVVDQVPLVALFCGIDMPVGFVITVPGELKIYRFRLDTTPLDLQLRPYPCSAIHPL